MSLLKELVKRVGEVKLDGVADKLEPLESGDCVVGILPEELKRLCAVYLNAAEGMVRHRKQLKARIEKLGGVEKATEKQLQKLRKFYDTERRQFNFIKTAFWSAVRCNFSEIIDDEPISIKKNWKVVIGRSIDKCETCEFRVICPLVGLVSGCLAL